MYIYHIFMFFIHSSVQGQLGGFHILPIANNAAMLGCRHCFNILYISLDKYPDVGFLEYVVAVF